MASYVNSVQYLTISIAASATTGTTSVSAPTGTYFVLWCNYTTTDTSTDTSSMPGITLSSNIFTATRVTSSAATITVILCVIDATNSLIKTIQFGTTAISNSVSSATSTVSAVTNNNTVIDYLGQSTNGTQSYGGNQCTVALSGTTVTAKKEFAGSTETVAWVVIEFQNAALNSSVQNIALTASQSGTSWTQTITSVTTANTLLIWGGFCGNSVSNPATVFQRASLTNSTTITINVNTSPFVEQDLNLCVVEFASGVLTSNAVQRGTIALSSQTSNTATVTGVGSGGVLNYVGYSSTATSANNATSRASITLTNSTTITEKVNTSASGTGSWELIDFLIAAAAGVSIAWIT